jgi:trk system potassium uptake protein TrkA
MRTIICGAGRVGQGIARRLAQEGHDVTLIDENGPLLREVADSLDVRGIVGHAAHPDVLAKADLANADILVAVTYSDEVNIIACHVAKVLFQTPRCLARVRTQAYVAPEAEGLMRADRGGLRVDAVISPELEVAKSVLQRLDVPGAFMSAPMVEGAAQFLGSVLDARSPVIGHPLGRLQAVFPDLKAEVIAIGRGERLFAPSDSDTPQAEDRVYLVTAKTDLNRSLEILGRTERTGQRVVIVGGGHIGVSVAKVLEARPNVRVRLIEANRAQAERAAAQLSRTIVIVGDGMSGDVLREAGADAGAAVVALTNDDRTNLLLSSLARKLGAGKVMSLLNDPQLAGLRDIVGVDAIINPRELSVSRVLLHLRRGRVLDLHSLEDGQGEVIEGLVLPTSGLVGRSVDEDESASGIRLGLVFRAGRVEPLPRNERIRENDRVVVFAEGASRREVERFFRVSAYY